MQIFKGSKMLLFLQEQVVTRPPKKRPREELNTNITHVLSSSTILSYVFAIQDLWAQQRGLGINNNPSPTETAEMRAFTESQRRKKATIKKSNHSDRGNGTLLDGYSSMDELRDLLVYFYDLDTGIGLRNRVAVAMCHFNTLRGEVIRRMEFADMFSILLENEGPSDCIAMVTVMDNGKTNKNGRLEYGACLRNRFVELCPIGSVAMHLFWRFHIFNEAFPQLDSVNFSDW